MVKYWDPRLVAQLMSDSTRRPVRRKGKCFLFVSPFFYLFVLFLSPHLSFPSYLCVPFVTCLFLFVRKNVV